MKVKHSRKEIVAQIINSSRIRTQEELASALAGRGIVTAQATLSRDIRELGAVKGPDGCYVIQSNGNIANHSTLVSAIEFSGQLCVVRTNPGFASAFASIVDNSKIDGIMGTIAGDDTVLVILRKNAVETQVSAALNSI